MSAWILLSALAASCFAFADGPNAVTGTVKSAAQTGGKGAPDRLDIVGEVEEDPFSKGAVVRTVNAGGATCAVSIRHRWWGGYPGTYTQYVELRTTKGEVLDRIECATHMHVGFGGTKTDVLRMPDRDGAQVVVRHFNDQRLLQFA